MEERLSRIERGDFRLRNYLESTTTILSVETTGQFVLVKEDFPKLEERSKGEFVEHKHQETDLHIHPWDTHKTTFLRF